jgi:hypothetical protein
MSRDLPQLFLLVCRQICLDILGVTADQVNTGGDYDVHLYDSRTTTFSLTLRRPSQFPRSASARYRVTGIGIHDQVNCNHLDAIGPDQLRGLTLELRYLAGP